MFDIIAEKIHSIDSPPNIDDILDNIRELLEESIDVSSVELQKWIKPKQIDLSKLDIKALKARLATGSHKRTWA